MPAWYSIICYSSVFVPFAVGLVSTYLANNVPAKIYYSEYYRSVQEPALYFAGGSILADIFLLTKYSELTIPLASLAVFATTGYFYNLFKLTPSEEILHTVYENDPYVKFNQMHLVGENYQLAKFK